MLSYFRPTSPVGHLEQFVLPTCSKCPTEIYGTKPPKPLKIGLPAFCHYAAAVYNRRSAGVYFFQGVNRSLLGQGFTFQGFTFSASLENKGTELHAEQTNW